MLTFEDRERAFEAKYAHDEEFRFRVIARRDKLFARQSAEQLSLSEQEAGELITAVLAVRDGPDHDGLLIRYMAEVFASHGRAGATEELSTRLDACAAQARQQLLAPSGGG